MVVPSFNPAKKRATLRRQGQRGALNIEILIAISILLTALLPISFTIARDQKRLRSLYHRSVAVQIVDGEMEMLAAGEWKSAPPGDSRLPVAAEAAKSLPSGSFILTRNDKSLSLRWSPANPGRGGPVERLIQLPPAP